MRKLSSYLGFLRALLLCSACAGYVLDTVNSVCVKNLKQSFTLTCPQHCEFDANGTCACVEEITSETACPPGFSLDAAQKNCTTVIETPATAACEQSNQKLLNNKCTGVIVLSPEFTCPVPAYLKGDLCVHEEVAAPFDECPPGFELTAAPTEGGTRGPPKVGRALQTLKLKDELADLVTRAAPAESKTPAPPPGTQPHAYKGESTGTIADGLPKSAGRREPSRPAAPLAQIPDSSSKRILVPKFRKDHSTLKQRAKAKAGPTIRTALSLVAAPPLATRSGGASHLADIVEKAAAGTASKRGLQGRGAVVGGGRLFPAGRGSRKVVEDDELLTLFDRHESERKKGLGIHGVGLGERGGGGLRGGGHLNFAGNLGAGASGGSDGHAGLSANNSELLLEPQQQQQMPVLVGETAKVCLSKTAISARPSCPPNHRLEKDACVSEIVEAAIMACTEGFHYDGATQNCVRETMQPPVLDCPDGYRVEGRQCVFTQIEEPQRSCRDGFIYSIEENLCIKILKEPPRFKCASSDYYFDGRTCEKTLTLPPTFTCASGRLLSDSCLIIETGPGSPSCNPGAALDPTQLKCHSSSVAPVKYTCLQGELSENRTCVNLTTAKPRVVCPEGFEMKGDTCMKEKTFQPVQSCPPNSQLIGSDCLLHTEEAPSYTCTSGFELHRDTCVMAKRVAPTQACAAGYTPYKEKCIRQTRRSGQITCPETFVYDGTQCVINDQQRPIYVCPEGYSLEEYRGDSCVPDSLSSATASAENAIVAAAAFPSSAFSAAAGGGGGIFDDRRKVGLQIMALGRRKPSLLTASS